MLLHTYIRTPIAFSNHRAFRGRLEVGIQVSGDELTKTEKKCCMRPSGLPFTFVVVQSRVERGMGSARGFFFSVQQLICGRICADLFLFGVFLEVYAGHSKSGGGR